MKTALAIYLVLQLPMGMLIGRICGLNDSGVDQPEQENEVLPEVCK